MTALERLRQTVASARKHLEMTRVAGVVTEVTPSLYRVAGLSRFVNLGDVVTLRSGNDSHPGEVVRIDNDSIAVKPFEAATAVGIGMSAHRSGPLRLFPDVSWKGRVIDAMGRPLDGAGPLPCGENGVPVDRMPPAAMERARANRAIRTGVRLVDIFTPICAGQRIGVFAGSGVGKSTLLAMLARAAGFDVVVFALVGERGREVREFLEQTLGDRRQRAVAVVSTGDESAAMRRLAPKTAMAVAEYFRDRGESVLLVMDSVTRFAHAARDVALAAGEPAVARGYAPSVFSDLPKLLERAGPGPDGGGSITGIFAVLVDGDDRNDPVADSIRGILDGHIVLDRAIADQGRYPAVNVLSSVSRLAELAWTPEERALVQKLRAMIARFEDTRDLRLMGGYHSGQEPELDQAIAFVPKIYQAMGQRPDTMSADAFKDLAAAMQT